ncbi:MAG: zeta toxin [Bacteroidales bacterium]|nr:zeta toxin [Bacteroidales bacterium]
MAKLYIIAGCNGAGKTTASYTVLPEMLACREFVNADEIARGLSPFNPESVAIEAGRLMLRRILPSPEHAIERVALRVKEGGHNIPEDVIRRRYKSGLANLLEIYLPICDCWSIYDNSSMENYVNVVASGRKNDTVAIENHDSYCIKNYGRG